MYIVIFVLILLAADQVASAVGRWIRDYYDRTNDR